MLLFPLGVPVLMEISRMLRYGYTKIRNVPKKFFWLLSK